MVSLGKEVRLIKYGSLVEGSILISRLFSSPGRSSSESGISVIFIFGGGIGVKEEASIILHKVFFVLYNEVVTK